MTTDNPAKNKTNTPSRTSHSIKKRNLIKQQQQQQQQQQQKEKKSTKVYAHIGAPEGLLRRRVLCTEDTAPSASRTHSLYAFSPAGRGLGTRKYGPSIRLAVMG